MSNKFRITIEVEGGKEEATIKTSNGDEFVVNGLALFGDAEHDGQLLNFFWNKPGMAAKAVVRGCACAINSGDEITTQFYRAILKGFSISTGIRQVKEVADPEEILSRWEDDLKLTIH